MTSQPVSNKKLSEKSLPFWTSLNQILFFKLVLEQRRKYA